MYHSLFPQLVAGPIVRYLEITHQIRDRPITFSRLGEGAYRFCIGLGKKIILADNLALVTDQILTLPPDQLTLTHAWIAMICYALQIYLDFSGYSDMAIGLGKFLGFDFPENFDQPYRASSVTEFWRKWHMTLTRWFRDYLYIPLGGNQHGEIRTLLNLWLVFCLCGLWHGAGLNFLIWGVYHGVLLVFERFAHQRLGWRAKGAAGSIMTLVLVTIGWVFFRIEMLSTALSVLKAMFGAGTADAVHLPVAYFLTPDIVTYLAIATAIALLPAGQLGQWRPERTSILVIQLSGALLVFGYAVLLLAANSFNPFIYFRF
jgi:alginate O-acetyltransferase complex protein AlgI